MPDSRMSITRRVLNILLLYSVAAFLTGCWDREEVNDLALVTAAGLDKKKDNRYELSIQIFIPRAPGEGQKDLNTGGGKDSGGQTIVRTVEGATIAEAMSLMQELESRRIFWGHDKVFIIGEKLAREGIRKHIDFLIRHPQVRESAFVFVSKGNVQDVLNFSPKVERSSAEVLRELAKSQIQMQVTLKDLNRMLSGDTGAAALPWIDFKSQPQQSSPPYIAGTAIFKKDRLSGIIDDNTTRGLLWVRDEMKTAVVTVRPKSDPGFVSMNLIRSRTQLVPRIHNGKWIITVKAETEDDIMQNGTELDMMDAKVSKMLEAEMEKAIKNKINKAIVQVQKKLRADIFGFADVFHRSYPKQWNEVKDHWDEIFPEIEVVIEVKANIRRPGMSNVPAGLPKEEVKKK
jgi:spore germination protein KC